MFMKGTDKSQTWHREWRLRKSKARAGMGLQRMEAAIRPDGLAWRSEVVKLHPDYPAVL